MYAVNEGDAKIARREMDEMEQRDKRQIRIEALRAAAQTVTAIDYSAIGMSGANVAEKDVMNLAEQFAKWIEDGKR